MEYLVVSRNGLMDTDGDRRDQIGQEVFYIGTTSSKKERKLNSLLLLFRAITFAFSLAAVMLMAFDSYSVEGSQGRKVKWHYFESYRYVLAVNAILCTYSLAEIGLEMWSCWKGSSLMPKAISVWFDYCHDQGFSYLVFSASSTGALLAHDMQRGKLLLLSDYTCNDAAAFCTQAEIAVAMSFAAFVFIALSALLSGFRVAKWLTNQ